MLRCFVDIEIGSMGYWIWIIGYMGNMDSGILKIFLLTTTQGLAHPIRSKMATDSRICACCAPTLKPKVKTLHLFLPPPAPTVAVLLR